MAAVMIVGTGLGSASPHAAATANGQPGTGGDIRLRPAAQVTRNDRADVTFELRPAASGGISVIARSGDLVATKTVQSTGEYVLELADGHDRLSIAASADGVVLTRGRTSVALRRDDRSEQAAGKARALLASSGSLVEFRGVAARLMEGEDRSASALALILADATVGLLSGDVGAPRRVGRFLVERRLRNARPAGMAIDCFTLMETRFVEAWNDYGTCYYSTSNNSFYQYLCSWRWTVQVESYWFNFISCTGFDVN
jgi:hypothetical protein